MAASGTTSGATLLDIKEQEFRAAYERGASAGELKRLAEEINNLYSATSKWRTELNYLRKESEGTLTFKEKLSHNTKGFIDSHGGNSTKLINGFNEIISGVKELVGIVKKFQSSWGEVDQAAFNYTKATGGSAERARGIRTNAIEQVYDRHLGDRFNVSPQELVKLQERYNTEVGRSVDLTNDQLENMSAMKGLMGDEKALAFATKFEKFGLDINTASKAAGEMFSDASERGVSFEEYSKNFLDNIQLAQSYSFENGLKGLSNMARKATELKLSMKEAVSFAEKTNTVEGAIKSAAGLSVLGGAFSQGANPMSMLYDSLNNMEGVEDRMLKMIGGMAKWNSEKNMVDISSFNKVRIRAAAEQMGVDSNELINSAMAQGRRRIAEKQINTNLDEKTRDLALNKAQIDKNGQAYVTINGEEKSVSKLTNGDYEALKKENQSIGEDVKDIAENLRGWNDVKEGVKKQFEVSKQNVWERFGIGETIKGITSSVGTSNFLLGSILAAILGIKVFGAGGSMVYGAGNMIGGTGLKMSGAWGKAKRISKGAWGMAKKGGSSLLKGGLKLIRFIKADGDVPDELPKINSMESPTSVISAKNTAKYKDELAMMNEGTYPKFARGTVKSKRHNTTHGKNNLGNLKNSKNTANAAKVGKNTSILGKGLKGIKSISKGAGATSAGILSTLITGYDEFFGEKADRDSTSEKIAKTAGSGLGAVGGALLGMYLGGPLGAFIGGWLGAEAGEWLGSKVGGTAQDKVEVASKNGFGNLRGIDTNTYSMDDVRDIIDGNADQDLVQVMKGNGDIALYNSKHGYSLAKGRVGKFDKGGIGIARGKKHSEGGIKTVIGGEPAEIEDGEAVVSAAKTRMYLPELKAMNEGRLPKINARKNNGYFKEGGIKQSNNNMGSLKVSEPQSGNYNFGAQEISFKPLDINFTGSIDLKGGGQTGNIDVKSLLNNPEFKREIANLIIKEVSTKIHKGNNKEETFSYQMGRH